MDATKQAISEKDLEAYGYWRRVLEEQFRSDTDTDLDGDEFFFSAEYFRVLAHLFNFFDHQILPLHEHDGIPSVEAYCEWLKEGAPG